MRHFAPRLYFASCAAIAIVNIASSANAQTDGGAVADIVVTGQKRAENVQDVPKSVDVVSSRELDLAGVTQLNDLSRVSPSIAGTSSLSGPPPIRGVSSFALSIGVQGQTGAVVDDIPQPQFSALINELSDVERVEVFAGPQSTLSGRNAAGGLINIVTRRPSRTFGGSFSAEVTEDHQERFTGFITGPLGPQFAFSLSGFYNDWDGALKNITLNRRIGGFQTYGGRAKLLWDGGGAVTATLTGHYVRSKSYTAGVISAGPYISINPDAVSSLDPATARRPLSVLFPGITPGSFNREVSSERVGVTRTKDRGVNLRLDIDVGDLGTISSLSNYQRADLPRMDNFVALPTSNPDPYARVTYESKNISQEVRLVSPGGQPLTYTIGAIYSDNDIYHPYSRLTFFGNPNWVRETSFASIAAFGRVTYDFGQGTSLTGGLRYQNDKQRYSWQFLTVASSPITDSAGSSRYDFLAGEISLKQAFTPNINAYVTLSRAETGEAYDLEDNSTAQTGRSLAPLASEKVKNIELGIKAQSDDRRLTANLNLFLAKYDNYQIQTQQPSNDPSIVPTIRTFAIGKVETKGIEFQGSWRPVDPLTLSLSAAYLDAKIKDFPNAQCYARQTAAQGCVGGLQDNLGGLSMPNTPKYKVNGSISYDVPLPTLPFDGTISLFGRYQSRSRADLAGNPIAKLPAYAIVNLNVGIRDREDKYRLTFFVNNLFDKNYYTNLADDTFLTVPGAATIPAITGAYARDSFRYAGIRLNSNF